MLDDDLDKSLLGLIEQWNIAEQRIKRAEQVRASEIVAPAIFELRYAGRKIIDSIEIVLSRGIPEGSDERKTVVSYIADATEDCVKAKHDAIDAMMNFVTTWFDDLEQKLGVDEIQHFFPTYLEVLGKIADIQEKIAESRKNRTSLRDAIYNRIDSDDYDRILGLYTSMKTSQERITMFVNKKRKKEEEDKSRSGSQTTKDNRLKYISIILGASGWVALCANQYHQSAFPFNKGFWSGLYNSATSSAANAVPEKTNTNKPLD